MGVCGYLRGDMSATSSTSPGLLAIDKGVRSRCSRYWRSCSSPRFCITSPDGSRQDGGFKEPVATRRLRFVR